MKKNQLHSFIYQGQMLNYGILNTTREKLIIPKAKKQVTKCQMIKSTSRCPANMSFPAHFRHLVICCEVSVDMFFQLMTSGYKKCILPLSVGVISASTCIYRTKFPFCSFLYAHHLLTADRTQHPPSVPNEGGRFSLHAVIGPSGRVLMNHSGKMGS